MTAFELPDSVREVVFNPTVGRLVLVVTGAVLIIAARRLIRNALTGRLHDNNTRYRARKLVGVASWIVIALFVAAVFSDKVAGVTVAFGVAGAGIAFALQEVIASVAGWIAINFSGFYRVGDRVMLGGIRGDVIDVGVLRTTLFEVGDWVGGDLYNGRTVRLANSFVFKEPVFNYSAEFPFLWDEVTVPIRHDSDRALARDLLERIAEDVTGDYARKVQGTWDEMTRNYVIEHARLEPMVTMVSDQNWITFTVRYVVEFKQRRTTKDILTRRILDAFDATHGAVRIATVAQEVTVVKPAAA